MGEVGLEPTKPEGGGFTARNNCHYTTLPKEHHYATGRAGKKRLQMHPDYLVNGESRQQDSNLQPFDYKSNALPVVLHRQLNDAKGGDRTHVGLLPERFSRPPHYDRFATFANRSEGTRTPSPVNPNHVR